MKNVKKKSKKQEEKIAKDIGGRTTPGSGALWFSKADVRNDKYLIEAKFTDSNSYQLKYTTWDKIKREAINDGLRVPVMQIDIQGSQYALLRVDDLEALAQDNRSAVLYVYEYTARKSKTIKPYTFEMFYLGADVTNKVPCVTYRFKCENCDTLALITWKDFKYIM